MKDCWTYQIIKSGDTFTLCEVYYDADGNPEGCTEPLTGIYESSEELIEDLELMLQDAKEKEVCNDIWEEDIDKDELTPSDRESYEELKRLEKDLEEKVQTDPDNDED